MIPSLGYSISEFPSRFMLPTLLRNGPKTNRRVRSFFPGAAILQMRSGLRRWSGRWDFSPRFGGFLGLCLRLLGNGVRPS